MTFVYDDESRVVPAFVNDHDGVAVQMESSDAYFGTDDYMGDEIVFESRATALAWARNLVAALEA